MPRPVVFIPGFPASELVDQAGSVVFPPSPGTLFDKKRKKAFLAAMLNVPGKLVAGPPIRSVLGIAKQAQSLYDLLASRGYTIPAHGKSSKDLAPVGWDWRQGVDATDTLDRVAKAIKGFGTPVVVIIHSTGALVFREFLKAYPKLSSRIAHVIAFGGAWCGTIEALHAMHVGNSLSFLGIPLLDADDGAELIGHAQAAWDLLPPDPTMTPMEKVHLVHDLSGKQAAPCANIDWVKPNRPYAAALAKNAHQRLGTRSPDFGTLPLTNVVGWGAPTWPGAVLLKNDVVFLPEDKNAGDNTVPLVSASWIRGPNVRIITIPIGAFVGDLIPDVHAHLWDSIAVKQVFDEVLGGKTASAFIAAAADAEEAINYDSPVTVRMTAQTTAGQPLPDCVAVALINGRKIPVPFAGTTRAILRVERAGIRHNAANDVYWFPIDFKWKGGSRKGIGVAFRSP